MKQMHASPNTTGTYSTAAMMVVSPSPWPAPQTFPLRACALGVEADGRMDARGLQLPIGLEDNHKGLVDVVRMRAVYFLGDHGQDLEETDVPAEMQEEAAAARVALIEQVHPSTLSDY